MECLRTPSIMSKSDAATSVPQEGFDHTILLPDFSRPRVGYEFGFMRKQSDFPPFHAPSAVDRGDLPALDDKSHHPHSCTAPKSYSALRSIEQPIANQRHLVAGDSKVLLSSRSAQPSLICQARKSALTAYERGLQDCRLCFRVESVHHIAMTLSPDSAGLDENVEVDHI